MNGWFIIGSFFFFLLNLLFDKYNKISIYGICPVIIVFYHKAQESRHQLVPKVYFDLIVNVSLSLKEKGIILRYIVWNLQFSCLQVKILR